MLLYIPNEVLHGVQYEVSDSPFVIVFGPPSWGRGGGSSLWNSSVALIFSWVVAQHPPSTSHQSDFQQYPKVLLCRMNCEFVDWLNPQPCCPFVRRDRFPFCAMYSMLLSLMFRMKFAQLVPDPGPLHTA